MARRTGRRRLTTRPRTRSTSGRRLRRPSTTRRCVPGSDPREDSLIAVDLATGKLKWWQQQMAFNEWAYDTSQPPMVYTAKVGGKSQRIVSVATMEGEWFAYNAATGAPIYQRIKVLDNVEHPDLVPGKPVAVYPSSLGGLNYSPASYDPETNYVYNAASETGSALKQQTPSQEQGQQLLLGNTFLGLANGDFGQYLTSGWKDYGSVSAIDVNTGKLVWKFDTPQPERGGVTTTAAGVGFVGGGDGNLRAFDAQTGKVLWTFQTGFQIAAGPTVYSVDGTEYVAITVGGTTTSSNGGTVASQLQVFALGGSQTQSTGPTFTTMQRASGRKIETAPAASRVSAQHVTAVAAGASAAKIVPPPSVMIQPWNPNTSNTVNVQGHVMLAGRPVAGALVSIDGWVAPPTDSSGGFTYPADNTMPGRHVVRVVDATKATVGGHKLSAAEQSELLHTASGINVGYSISDVTTRKGPENSVVLSGKISYGQGVAPSAGPALQLSAERDGDRCERKSGDGSCRHHEDERPQVLDVLPPDRRFGQVRLLPGRRRPGGRQSSADVGRRLRRRQRLHRADHRSRELLGAEERHARHPAPVVDRSDSGEDLDQSAGGARRDLPRAGSRGRGRQRRRHHAAQCDLAGLERTVHSRATGLGARQGGEVLGERTAVLLDDRGQAGPEDGPVGVSEVPGGDDTPGARHGSASEVAVNLRTA